MPRRDREHVQTAQIRTLNFVIFVCFAINHHRRYASSLSTARHGAPSDPASFTGGQNNS
jgi:hypothetical protein